MTGCTYLERNGQASIYEDGSFLAYGMTEVLNLLEKSW
jgi:hypothetical protein